MQEQTRKIKQSATNDDHTVTNRTATAQMVIIENQMFMDIIIADNGSYRHKLGGTSFDRAHAYQYTNGYIYAIVKAQITNDKREMQQPYKRNYCYFQIGFTVRRSWWTQFMTRVRSRSRSMGKN